MTHHRKKTDGNQATRSGPQSPDKVSEIVDFIQAAQDRIRQQIEADPLLWRQVYEGDDDSLDGLTKDMVDELRQFLNIPKPARAKVERPRKGTKA